MPARKGLTDKQLRFIQEYLVDLNAAGAARRAGYSERTADRTGHENLRKPEIAAAIAAAQNARGQRLEITADRVLQEIARVAFSDLRNYVEWSPGSVVLKDCKLLTEDQAAAVAEVSETRTETGGTTRLKLHSKVNALDKLCRHLGLYQQPDTDDVDDRQVDDYLAKRCPLNLATTGGPGPAAGSGVSPIATPPVTPKARKPTAGKSSRST